MITFIVPISDEEIYNRDIKQSLIFTKDNYRFIEKRGFTECRKAFNDALENDNITTEYICFLHQDIFMRDNFEYQLDYTLTNIKNIDPNHGVLGPAGAKYINPTQIFLVGSTYWYAYKTMWGNYDLSAKGEFAEVDTLDGLMLICKTEDIINYRFDDNYKGYNHFYDIELCLEMKKLGKKNYAIPALVEHRCSSVQDRNIQEEFKQLQFCAEYCRDKYPESVPFSTTCVVVEKDNIKFL